MTSLTCLCISVSYGSKSDWVGLAHEQLIYGLGLVINESLALISLKCAYVESEHKLLNLDI